VNLIGFNHVAINTLDIEKSISFYRGILGLKQMNTVDTEESVSSTLIIPGGLSIELLMTHGLNGSQPNRPDIILDHLAFNVDDVALYEEYLRKAGVDIIMPCTELPNFNTRLVKCKDPNGIVIAFRKDIK
jgi:glyoxylase I family protein